MWVESAALSLQLSLVRYAWQQGNSSEYRIVELQNSALPWLMNAVTLSEVLTMANPLHPVTSQKAV